MKAYLLIAVLGCLALVNAQGTTKPTETLKNLNEAYQDEANAHKRYAIFAKKADEEGFAQIGKLFRAASRSEQAHRDAHKEAIEKLGGKAPAFTPEKVKVGTTRQNLEASLKGETYESVTMYPEFIKKAKEANAEAAVRSFNFARLAEAEHAKLYKNALNNLGKNAKIGYFVCPVCGNTDTKLPAKKCPVCGNPRDNWLKIE